jgi:hypothetical protein
VGAALEHDPTELPQHIIALGITLPGDVYKMVRQVFEGIK